MMILPKGNSLLAIQKHLCSSGVEIIRRDSRAYEGVFFVDGVSDKVCFMPADLAIWHLETDQAQLIVLGNDKWHEADVCDRQRYRLGHFPKSLTRNSVSAHVAVVGTPESFIKKVKTLITEYPNITRVWCNQQGIHPTIVPVQGGAEAGVIDDTVMAVCVVETGTTLKANNLRVVTRLRAAYPIVVVRKDDSRMRQLLQRLTG